MGANLAEGEGREDGDEGGSSGSSVCRGEMSECGDALGFGEADGFGDGDAVTLGAAEEVGFGEADGGAGEFDSGAGEVVVVVRDIQFMFASAV